jgi:hypothetical protein
MRVKGIMKIPQTVHWILAVSVISILGKNMTSSAINQDMMWAPKCFKELSDIQKEACPATWMGHETMMWPAVHHELFNARSSKSLGWEGTAITHYTMNGTFVTRHEHVQRAQLNYNNWKASALHYLTYKTNVFPSGHTCDITEHSHKHLSKDKKPRSVS